MTTKHICQLCGKEDSCHYVLRKKYKLCASCYMFFKDKKEIQTPAKEMS